MEDQLGEIEYFDKDNSYWSQCKVKGIFGEKSFIVFSTSDQKERIVPIENLRKITSASTVSSTTNECEYEEKAKCFVPCKIKSQKGKFYSVLFEDDRGVKLTREALLRQVTSSFFSSVLTFSYSNIVLPIPKELTNWFGSESYKEMIRNIQEDPHDPVSFYINCYPESSPSFLRVLCLKDKAELIKLIIETAIEHELKLTHLDNDKVTTLKQLKTVQALNKVFLVANKFIGMLIGARGKNIKYLSSTYKVTINFDKLNENQSKVTICGNNATNVEQCFTEMNLQEQVYEIRYGYEKGLKEQSMQFIQDFHLNTFYVSTYAFTDENGIYYRAPNVKIIGPEAYLNELIQKINYALIQY